MMRVLRISAQALKIVIHKPYWMAISIALLRQAWKRDF